jgi:hypothetical protein
MLDNINAILDFLMFVFVVLMICAYWILLKNINVTVLLSNEYRRKHNRQDKTGRKASQVIKFVVPSKKMGQDSSHGQQLSHPSSGEEVSEAHETLTSGSFKPTRSAKIRRTVGPFPPIDDKLILSSKGEVFLQSCLELQSLEHNVIKHAMIVIKDSADTDDNPMIDSHNSNKLAQPS